VVEWSSGAGSAGQCGAAQGNAVQCSAAPLHCTECIPSARLPELPAPPNHPAHGPWQSPTAHPIPCHPMPSHPIPTEPNRKERKGTEPNPVSPQGDVAQAVRPIHSDSPAHGSVRPLERGLIRPQSVLSRPEPLAPHPPERGLGPFPRAQLTTSAHPECLPLVSNWPNEPALIEFKAWYVVFSSGLRTSLPRVENDELRVGSCGRGQ
jgi:hypothetical protein